MSGPRPDALYVHVPFCTRRCSYCDFAVQATAQAPTAEWIAAVAAELGLQARDQEWHAPLRLSTVYIGGGTPSLLGADAMERLRDALSPHAVWDDDAEWTCEANPESFTPEIAKGWAAAGVNRISLGAQSFHPGTLRWMGRLHGPQGPARALGAARDAGLANVSLDLIFGVPERLGRDWAADLYHTLALEPQHVSLYGLTAEAGAPLGRWVQEGRESLADDDRYADEFMLAHRTLTGAGLQHYEVSNFGLPGRHSRHNWVYWRGDPYAALGPGAHAFHPPERRWNVRGWDRYRDRVAAGELPLDGRETVDEETRALESVWLGLRTIRGFPLDSASGAAGDLLDGWRRRGLATTEDGRVRLTAEGWLLLDQLAVDLAAALEPAPLTP
jgi:oxygen-independent coproporphyrinogen III oxidase